MLATVPFSNSIRAFAASTLSEITGMPTARTSETETSSPTEPLHGIEVVDHYIEHNIDVERAIGKRRHAMYLKIQRRSDVRPERYHCRIAAFELADHQFCADAAAAAIILSASASVNADRFSTRA